MKNLSVEIQDLVGADRHATRMPFCNLSRLCLRKTTGEIRRTQTLRFGLDGSLIDRRPDDLCSKSGTGQKFGPRSTA
ncbi:hypothetical protein MGN01_15350 [Methylobacterium gnaphalii]|uniref:Uncharacterized protein n=1 Tax=Methylobacterium gnaphalii TaxID=1010610 RepID=A0A512JIA2_9HYPH|nr:hypothetical protein MGN01_15350 [Methylobacterium gnaphalii]GLS50108.1 hypothetical protein GCM10007885_29600 [Methylobacterium gnaphalii]